MTLFKIPIEYSYATGRIFISLSHISQIETQIGHKTDRVIITMDTGVEHVLHGDEKKEFLLHFGNFHNKTIL